MHGQREVERARLSMTSVESIVSQSLDPSRVFAETYRFTVLGSEQGVC